MTKLLSLHGASVLTRVAWHRQEHGRDSKVSLLRRRWLQMLLSGIVLLFLVERTLIATSNPNFAPSVILLGAFLVPVTFVTYLYERLPSLDVPLPALAVCFLWGGVLATVVAGTLEYDVAGTAGFLAELASV